MMESIIFRCVCSAIFALAIESRSFVVAWGGVVFVRECCMFSDCECRPSHKIGHNQRAKRRRQQAENLELGLSRLASCSKIKAL